MAAVVIYYGTSDALQSGQTTVMQSSLFLYPPAKPWPPSGLFRLALVWILTLSLLLVQTLGAMHRVLHASSAGSSTLAVAGQNKPLQAQEKTRAAVGLATLFSSHASDTDCRLYDQASHGSAALHVVALALPVVLPSFVVAIFQGEALARWAALFDARGPPLTC